MDFFGYGMDDFIPCENCESRAVDVHHITEKSQLGKDEINNLIALCRKCHKAAHDEKIDEDTLRYMHKVFINKQPK